MKKTTKKTVKKSKKTSKAAQPPILCSRQMLKDLKKGSKEQPKRVPSTGFTKPLVLDLSPPKKNKETKPQINNWLVQKLLGLGKITNKLDVDVDVAELRQAGYKVRVTHLRPISRNTFSQKGGVTQVAIKTPEGKELFGESRCSWSDQYCYRTGRQLAISRALGVKNENV